MTIATDTTNPAQTADDTSAPAPPPAPASESARRFAIEAARLAAQTRCDHVVVLDVSRVSPVTDFFVVATGSSGRQMRSVANEIEDFGRQSGNRAMGRHGHEGESWILTDFVDVVVHLFSPEARGYYDLDGLWGDAPSVDWQTGAPPPRNAPSPAADADDGEGFAPANRSAAVDDDDYDLAGDDDDEDGAGEADDAGEDDDDDR